MSQWLERHISLQRIQVASTAVLASIITAGVIFGSIAIRRRAATEDLKGSIPALSDKYRAQQLTEYGAAAPPSLTSKEDAKSAQIAARARKGEYDEELILEQLARNRVFLTDDGLKNLRSSFVVVVGLGGVGSHATAALARSGVARIRVIDFDQVTLSSLNRHAVATLADVGTPKVHCMRKRLEQITPWLRLDCRNELFSSQSADKLLGKWDYELQNGEERDKKPDFVVDCIDNINSKVALLQYCYQHSLNIISSMGAGCKSDPTRVCIGDISGSVEDPLSRVTRRRLKILGINQGIPVIFSTEKPGPRKAALIPLSDEEYANGEVGDLSVLPDFRVRILPVLGTMPAIFGYAAATHVICKVAGYPLEYRAGEKGRDKMYEGMLSALQALEERLVRTVKGQNSVGLRIPLGKDDVQYLVEEVFRGRSVVSGLTSRLALLRWRKPAEGYVLVEDPATQGQRVAQLRLNDLVCMSKDEAQKHEDEVLKGDKQPEHLYDAEVLATVARRQKEEHAYEKYR